MNVLDNKTTLSAHKKFTAKGMQISKSLRKLKVTNENNEKLVGTFEDLFENVNELKEL